MTSPHTPVRAESPRAVQVTETVRTRFLDPIGVKTRAQELQRKGKTLSEIAEEIDCRREAIVQMLYWDRVIDVA